MNKLIISAPFGNYFNWQYCTSTLGTYTREFRAGFLKKWWRVISTVRYYPGIQAWKNKLGLPNPGINHIIGLPLHDKIVSVSAKKTEDWLYLLNAVDPMAMELNVSCPNTPGEKDYTDYEVVFKAAAVRRFEVIVKLPPVNFEERFSLAVSQGILSFHCCNTWPTPGGGMSGKPLKPLSLSVIKYIMRHGKLRRIIGGGGGGVTSMDDVKEYLDAGATNVAVASILFNPFAWKRIKEIARTLL